MKSFTSKDFGKTGDRLTPEIPDKLIHRQVNGGAGDEAFSRERKHPVQLVDLPTKTLSVTIGEVGPGQATGTHRHNYETVLYVLEGEGVTFIEGREVEWEAGDAVYIPVWAWHSHRNRSATKPCRYLACENAPLLQNLGIALREEKE